jgi:hypothetical protein
LNYYPEELQEKLLEEIQEDGKISEPKLIEILDTYQFLPLKIKRDKNKSEDVYYILNSNMRGAF